MNLDELINRLEEVRDEHGGELDTAAHGLNGRIKEVKVTEEGVKYCYFE